MMNSIMRLVAPSAKKILYPLLSVILFITMPAWGETLTLNGYTFNEDSDELLDNPYFSHYERMVDIFFPGYGYGEFVDYKCTRQFHQRFAYQGIECITIRERGAFPATLSEYTGTSVMALFTGYYYYAKDTDDNVHLLMMSIIPDDHSIEGTSWSIDDLAEGATSVIYPADPVVDQEVLGGYVSEVAACVGNISNCLVIINDCLPYNTGVYSGPSTQYLSPDRGLIAITYNIDSGINGYSADGIPPEHAEAEDSGWDEWVDEHWHMCFVSSSAHK